MAAMTTRHNPAEAETQTAVSLLPATGIHLKPNKQQPVQTAHLELEMTDDMPAKNAANMGMPSSTIPPPP